MTSGYSKIIWHEGMLLKPQHLQQQDAYFEQSLKLQLTAFKANQWGYLQLELDSSLLALNQVQIIHATGKFADGTLFVIPEQSKPLNALHIESIERGQWVYLTLPMTPASNPIISMDNDPFSQYWSFTAKLSDYLRPEVAPESINLAKLNLNLMQACRPPSGYLSLPVLAIEKISNTKGIRVQDSYLPPSVNIGISTYFSNKITHLLHSLQQKLLELKPPSQLHETYHGQIQAIQLASFKLRHSMAQPLFHPESLYLLLVELISQLSAYQNKSVEIQSNYLHSSPAESLIEAFACINQLLASPTRECYESIPLNEIDPYTFQSASISAANLQMQFILGIRLTRASEPRISEPSTAELNSSSLSCPILNSEEILSHIKVASPLVLNILLSQALPGLELIPIEIKNLRLTTENHSYYYRINTQSQLWQSVIESQRLVIHATAKLGSYQPRLWVTSKNVANESEFTGN